MPTEFPDVAGVSHRYVEANGARIHLAEAGPEDSGAIPILLLHGWPQHWYMWRKPIETLAAERRLLAPDLRGFGWSEAPGCGYDGETFAADQVELIDALGLERVDVVGHDWGGWTAMLLGILHPAHVRRIVVCNAPHPYLAPSAGLFAEFWRAWYTWVLATPALGRRSLAHGWITRNVLERGNFGSPFSPEEIEMYVDSFRAPERSDAIVHLYRYYQRVVRDGLRGRWRGTRLTVPALLLFGQGDRYLSTRLVAGGERHADDLTVELISDSGHFLVDERPDLVVRRVREFLGV